MDEGRGGNIPPCDLNPKTDGVVDQVHCAIVGCTQPPDICPHHFSEALKGSGITRGDLVRLAHYEWNTDGHSPMLSKDAVRAAILAERETAKTMYDPALGGDYSRALAEGMERACCHIEEAMDLPCSFERKHFWPRQTEQADDLIIAQKPCGCYLTDKGCDVRCAEHSTKATLDVHAIRARADAATPGPWGWNDGEEGFEVGPSDWHAYQREPFSADNPHPGFAPNGDPGNEAQREQLLRDEEFIAHARQDVPALLDRIECLHTENADLSNRSARTSNYLFGWAQRESDPKIVIRDALRLLKGPCKS